MECIRCHTEIPDDSVFCNYCGKRQQSRPKKTSSGRRPKGSGSITFYKARVSSGKPYIARDTKKRYLGAFASRSEAVIFLDRWKAEQDVNPLASYTLEQVYEAWSEDHYKTISKSAISQNTSAFEKASNLHYVPIKVLKTADYQAIVTKLANEGKSLSLCQKQKQFFSMLCKWAMANDIIQQNYADFIKITAKEKDPAKNDRVFTLSEIEKIESFVTDLRLGRTAKITMMLIYSGFRINELLYLRQENVNLKTGIMIGGEKTAAGRNRHVPIHPKVRPYIEEFMRIPGTYLIQSSNGSPLSNDSFGKSYKSLMSKCGISGVKVHTTRHTTSTLLLSSGVSPNVVKAILGHASISTTVDVYDHPSDKLLTDGIMALK